MFRLAFLTAAAAVVVIAATSLHAQEKPKSAAKKAAANLPPEPYTPHPDSKPRPKLQIVK